jgi:hypothetical protein
MCAFNTTLEIEMDRFVLVGKDTTTREDGFQKLLTSNALSEAKELAEVWMTQDVAENVGIYKLVFEGTPPQKHVTWTMVDDQALKTNGASHKPELPRANHRWTPTEDKALIQARKRGKGIAEIALDMKRTEKAVAVRAARLCPRGK